MLYHPNSPYYRQFLSASAKQRKNKIEAIYNTQVASKAMPNVNPGSVGL